VIAIGAAGHRYLAEIDKVTAGIRDAIHHVAKSFPGHELTILSSLAEGSDRLIASVALDHFDARLVAVLPMAREDYVADFTADSSLAEFDDLLSRAAEVVELDAVETRPEAYAAAGSYIVSRSDVIVIVWDGLEAQGRGGTAEIVGAARRARIPIAWVRAGNRRPGTDTPTSLGESQGSLSLEGF
jgi:hypothetical protein